MIVERIIKILNCEYAISLVYRIINSLMENVDFSAILGEAQNSQELNRITSFIYDMTKDELPQTTERSFSFYRCLARKLAALNSSALEEELAPPQVSPCPDVTQSPPTIGKCGNTEDSAHAKPVYHESSALEVPPVDSPRLKESLAARLVEEEPEMYPEKDAEEEQPFNEVVVGVSIFAEEDPRRNSLSSADANAGARPSVSKQAEECRQPAANLVAAPSKESNSPMYRLESIRCSKEEVVIRMTANDFLTSQAISAPPFSSSKTHKEVKIPREERRKIMGAGRIAEQKSYPKSSAAELAKTIGNAVHSRKSSANSEARKRPPLRDRAAIKKVAEAAEGEMGRLSEDSKYVKFGSKFFMRVSVV